MTDQKHLAKTRCGCLQRSPRPLSWIYEVTVGTREEARGGENRKEGNRRQRGTREGEEGEEWRRGERAGRGRRTEREGGESRPHGYVGTLWVAR